MTERPRDICGQQALPVEGRRPVRCWVPAVLGLLLAACSETPTGSAAVERVQAGPLLLSVQAQGELRSSRSVPLLVPGDQWSQRQIIWMKADGSRVEAGEVIARFSGQQSEVELSKALLDLERNLLAREAKQAELDALDGRVAVDLAQVGTELSIARRYADADLAMFARNEILDAIQDRRFLGNKQDVLQWKRDQTSDRGAAEQAVLDSQRASFEGNAERRRRELQALELRAPNDGVLVLATNWSGEKPKLGANINSGQEFASLPDPSSLEVHLTLPQQMAQGLAVGQEVELHPLGRPEQMAKAQLSWVATTPQLKGRGNPVKYMGARARVDAADVRRYGWVPGQAMAANIILAREERALSVPNVALRAEGGHWMVEVLTTDGPQTRTLTLGPRGLARSQVLDGLEDGDILLLAESPAGAGS